MQVAIKKVYVYNIKLIWDESQACLKPWPYISMVNINALICTTYAPGFLTKIISCPTQNPEVFSTTCALNKSRIFSMEYSHIECLQVGVCNIFSIINISNTGCIVLVMHKDSPVVSISLDGAFTGFDKI